jgi:ribonuclease III
MQQKAQDILGHVFGDPSLLEVALTHASSADHRGQSNERMEFLGDAILGMVVSEHIFEHYPDYLEGELTKIKSAVVSRRACAQVSEELDLLSVLSMGKGMSGRAMVPSSVAAAVLESVIAAIYLDGGMDAARAFIVRHMRPLIEEAARSTHQRNFKSLLQQHVQQQMTAPPVYVLLDEKGPDHSKCFQVCVEINGRRYDPAWAPSKKEAEQLAALAALRALDVPGVDEALSDSGAGHEADRSADAAQGAV